MRMDWLKKLLADTQKTDQKIVISSVARKEKVEKAAKDFAVRFEDVMKELAKS